MGKRLEINLPEPDPAPMPDLGVHPVVSDLRERLARLEERTRELPDRTASEALTLAQSAADRTTELAERMTQLETANAAGIKEIAPAQNAIPDVPAQPPILDPTPPAEHNPPPQEPENQGPIARFFSRWI
jgi:1,6-anhydro-N-acetylmuramate kinase